MGNESEIDQKSKRKGHRKSLFSTPPTIGTIKLDHFIYYPQFMNLFGEGAHYIYCPFIDHIPMLYFYIS